MYLIPIYLTFFSFISSFFLGKWIGKKGSIVISIVSIFIANILSLIIFYDVCLLHNLYYIKLFNWISVFEISIFWGFVLDSLSATMFVVVTTISVCAHIYSVDYMQEEYNQSRFFAYLGLFTFFMLVLVASDNFLQLFLGWEGVGICSYLLINFWYKRVQANKAALLAVMANKIGDIALLISCILIQLIYKSLDFTLIYACIPSNLDFIMEKIDDLFIAGYLETSALLNNVIVKNTTLICFLFVVGAVGKSAQSGFHLWLPEAMEGPTPVSSLIHAATMVTAGIFLILRCSFFFEDQDSISLIMLLVGAFTAFFAATMGLFQNDIKKIVAYSTCSQLGYMFMSCGLSGYSNSMYHLFNHAFFKALLFLTAGYLIHCLSNEQDVRKMGGLLRILPLSYILFLIGSLSLIGFPFFSGFYSKDKIIELLFSKYKPLISNFVMLDIYYLSQILGCLAIILTIVYSVKSIYYVFLGNYKGSTYKIINIHYGSLYSQLPLLFLSIVSISSGYLTSDMMCGTGSLFWIKTFSCNYFDLDNIANFSFRGEQYCDLKLKNINRLLLINSEYNYYVKYLAAYWILYFALVINFLYLVSSDSILIYFLNTLNKSVLLVNQITKKYLFINRLIVNKLVSTVYDWGYSITYLLVDKGILEYWGPFGLNIWFSKNAMIINKFNTGLIYHYIGFILISLIVVTNVSICYII